MKETILEDFLRYVKIDTQSDSSSTTIPSTEKQKDLSRLLCKELEALGLSVVVDDYGFVYTTIASNVDINVPSIGFLAHIDTAPDYSGKDVKPQVLRDYQGQDVEFADGSVMSGTQFPELLNYVGKTVITTDGTTLLGADDKAGIAILMQMVKQITANPQIKHGEIQICFSVDEEIGTGVDNIDLKQFTPDYAYTIDGGGPGQLNYETFNAAGLTIKITGRNVHPGHAKGKMVNAINIALEFASLLPKMDQPEFTENYEGFYMLHNMQASIENTTVQYIVRDHDRACFNYRKDYVVRVLEELKLKYPIAKIEYTLKDQYYNMKERIDPVYFIVDYAKQAIDELGMTTLIEPIRGGTDGSKLSYVNIPCPNIFTGGHNAHGRYEFACLEVMELSYLTVMKIIEKFSTHAK